jgi:predicted PurR-regulated permease PerM
MWLLAKRTAVVLSTTLLFAVLVAFIYSSRRILIAFLFAIFFAYLLEPWVLRMQLWTKGPAVLAALRFSKSTQL